MELVFQYLPQLQGYFPLFWVCLLSFPLSALFTIYIYLHHSSRWQIQTVRNGQCLKSCRKLCEQRNQPASLKQTQSLCVAPRPRHQQRLTPQLPGNWTPTTSHGLSTCSALSSFHRTERKYYCRALAKFPKTPAMRLEAPPSQTPRNAVRGLQSLSFPLTKGSAGEELLQPSSHLNHLPEVTSVLFLQRGRLSQAF